MDALCAICGDNFDKRGRAKACSAECSKLLRAQTSADHYRANRDAILDRHARYRDDPVFISKQSEYDRQRYDLQRVGKPYRPSSTMTPDERKLARRAYHTAYARRRRQAAKKD